MKQILIGVLRMTRGKFRRLVVPNDQGEPIEVSPRQGLQIFPGDKVRVELVQPKWARFRRRGRTVLQASVIEVLERGSQAVLGHYRVSNKRTWVVPKDRDVLEPLEVERKPGVPEGALVAVDLGKNPGMVSGKIAAVWTDPEAPRAMIEQLIFERGLPREFPQEVLQEADRFPEKLSPDDVAGRVDLRRSLEVVVIDPADAKDHDDAVSWEPAAAGGGRLGVHIADVSHYVRPGTALDREAGARGVSCYLTDRVIPMLPLRLSADLCSLMEGRDRLSRTAFISFDAAGRVQGGEICESVIRPTVLFSYEQVWEILQDRHHKSPYASTLRAMNDVAAKLREGRFADGSLDFSFPETKVILDAQGEPAGIKRLMSDPAHWLIEEFMIAANKFVGEHLTRQGLGIWRIHEPPKMEDVLELEEFLKGLRVRLRRGSRSRDLHPKDFQALLAQFKGTPEEYVVQKKVLQSLRLAVYSEHNVGHFGLALKDYAHFTSPIRRYADLIVHRLTQSGDRVRGKRYAPRQLGVLAGQISALERRAQEAEWACTKKMVLRYLRSRIGTVFMGTISRTERFGVFVELDGIGADGLIRLEDLGNERYWLARDGMSLQGRRSGRAIKVGERVKVVIVRIDQEAGHLDLAFADE